MLLERKHLRASAPYVRSFSRLFAAEYKLVARHVGDVDKALEAVDEFGKYWLGALVGLWTRVGDDAGRELYQRFSRHKSWDLTGWASTAAARAREAAKRLVARTKHSVRKLLTDAKEDAGAKLKDLYDGWAKVRGRSLADGEARSAKGEAEEKAAMATRRPLTKTWCTMGDERVRDTHQEFDGTSRAIGEEWDEGLKFPRDPDCPDLGQIIQCRCWLIYSA